MKKTVTSFFISLILSMCIFAVPEAMFSDNGFIESECGAEAERVGVLEISCSLPTYIPETDSCAKLSDESLYNVIEEGLRNFNKK